MSQSVLRSLGRVAAATLLALAFNAAAQPAAPVGAITPESFKKQKAAPFDLTGTWQHELRGGQSWKFVPEKFELTPEAQKHYDAARKATAEGKVYRDDIGQCWPAGLPLIMTRVWPDRDDPASDGDLHDQRVHEQRPDRLPRRPPAHRSGHRRERASTANRSATGKATRSSSTRSTSPAIITGSIRAARHSRRATRCTSSSAFA